MLCQELSLSEGHGKWKWSRNDAKKQSTSKNTKAYFPRPAASNTNGLLFSVLWEKKEAARYGERTAVEIAERKLKVRKEKRNTPRFSALLHYHCRHVLFPTNQSTGSGHRVCWLASARAINLARGEATLQCASRTWAMKRVQILSMHLHDWYPYITSWMNLFFLEKFVGRREIESSCYVDH
jgi:hypothetical protein